jgi:hypothetical protein
MDFRHYLAESLQISPGAIQQLCSLPAESASKDLELIIVRVMHQPDGSLPFSAILPPPPPTKYRFTI